MGEAARNLLSQSDLPEVRGRYSLNAPLGKVGWFRTGGQADILFKPADVEDLQKFLSEVNESVPVKVLGVLSNAIIRDNGVEGVVIRLGREFNVIKELEDHQMYFGSAVLDVNAAEAAADIGIAGLEFLCGIPGSIGGALALNAGAYGSEIRDVLVHAEFIDKKRSASALNCG